MEEYLTQVINHYLNVQKQIYGYYPELSVADYVSLRMQAMREYPRENNNNCSPYVSKKQEPDNRDEDKIAPAISPKQVKAEKKDTEVPKENRQPSALYISSIQQDTKSEDEEALEILKMLGEGE